MKLAKCESLPTENEMAVHFLQRLSHEYNGLLHALDLDLIKNPDAYPKTLELAMNMATQYERTVLAKRMSKARLAMSIGEKDLDEDSEHDIDSCMPVITRAKGKAAKQCESQTEGTPKSVKVPREILDAVQEQTHPSVKCFGCERTGHLKKDCKLHQWKKEQWKVHGKDIVFCLAADVIIQRERDRANSPREGEDDDLIDVEPLQLTLEEAAALDASIREAEVKHRASEVHNEVIMAELGIPSMPDAARVAERVAVFASARLKTTELGLDTMSGVSGTCNLDLVSHELVRPDSKVLFGIGGTMEVTRAGSMIGTGIETWIFPEGYPSIVSFHKLHEKVGVSWDRVKGHFTALVMGVPLIFKPKSGVYVADVSALIDKYGKLAKSGVGYAMPVNATDLIYDTVEGRKQQFTKAQVRRAELAVQMLRKLADPSPESLCKMLNSGAILNCPITAKDVRRAMNLFGPTLESIRGKTKRQQSPVAPDREISDRPLLAVDMEIFMDIMFIDGMPALVSVAGDTKYLQVTWIKSRNYRDVMPVVLKHISVLARQGFKVTGLTADGEGAIAKTEEALPEGCQFKPQSTEQHVGAIEVWIRIIKERMRGIMATLPFRLDRTLLMWLLLFVVSRLMMTGNHATNLFVSPYETVFGLKPDYSRDLLYHFGQIVELHKLHGPTNSLDSRTGPGVALMSTANGDDWFIMDLSTGKVKKRRATSCTAVRITTEMIDVLNRRADMSRPAGKVVEFVYGGNTMSDEPQEWECDDAPGTAPPSLAMREPRADDADNAGGPYYEPSSMMDDEVKDEPAPPHPASSFEEATRPTPRTTLHHHDDDDNYEGEIPGLPTHERISSSDDSCIETTGLQQGDVVESTEAVQISGHMEYQEAEDATIRETGNHRLVAAEPRLAEPRLVEPRRAGYNLRGVMYEPMPWREKKAREAEAKSASYSMRISVNDALNRLGKKAVDSMTKELLGLHNARWGRPVRLKDLSFKQRKKIIRSFMFLKEKYLSTGEFDKLKARLVAGGHMQQRDEYRKEDTTSPTVSLCAMYITAAIAAMEGRDVATADVGSAYLKATLNREIHMLLEPKLAALLAEAIPSYGDHLAADGTLLIRLEKALYGLIESSKLWYDTLSGFLIDSGFTPNGKDRCVYNKIYSGKQLTVAFYVDDLIMTCADSRGIDWILQLLKERFTDLTITRGKKHSYLGQTLDFTVPRLVKITMEGYVESILMERKNDRGAATPASEDLFEIDTESPKLDTASREAFHTIVMKIQYLAKRVRPDLLTASTFLNSRVQAPTEQDSKKLDRVIDYLYSTRILGIKLGGPSGVIAVTAYVDASYGVHHDFRSQTGSVISIGGGPVHVSASKQKLNSKSSTEAELIGLSDSLSQVLWIRDFLLEQGHALGPAAVKQDNQSTMIMANKGISTSERTRHIGIRYFWVRDRIESKEVSLEYLETENMVADILTKPLQGSHFRRMRGLLLNWD